MLLILREEIICMVILLFLMFYYAVNKIKDRELLFIKLASLALLHVIFDVITVITVNHRDIVPDNVNRLLHIGFYVTGILFAIWFYDYIVERSVSYKYVRILKAVGYVVLTFFVLLLLALPMEYRTGNGTEYSYGPLAIVGYAIFLLYCTASLAMILVFRKKLDQRVRRALIPMIMIMYVAVILQALIPELLMTGANVTLICIALFVAMDNPDKDFMRQAFWDFSTGLKNRNCYNRDIARYAEQNTTEKIGIVLADMNYLKYINDNYGHAEGDKLIAAAASVLREHLKSAENVYRVGGDEFVAVYLSPDDNAVAAEMEAVVCGCTRITQYAVPLSIAIGYSAGSIAEEGIEAVFKRADELMYANKQQIKKAAPHLSPDR